MRLVRPLSLATEVYCVTGCGFAWRAMCVDDSGLRCLSSGCAVLPVAGLAAPPTRSRSRTGEASNLQGIGGCQYQAVTARCMVAGESTPVEVKIWHPGPGSAAEGASRGGGRPSGVLAHLRLGVVARLCARPWLLCAWRGCALCARLCAAGLASDHPLPLVVMAGSRGCRLASRPPGDRALLSGSET